MMSNFAVVQQKKWDLEMILKTPHNLTATFTPFH